jgi:hypothetical protein
MNGDRWKMSGEHLKKIGVGESNGDVISGLGRHIAAEVTFSQSTRKPSPIDEYCQWNTYRKSGSENRMETPIAVWDAT